MERSADAVIALDLGGTKLAAALVDADGAAYDRRVTPLDGRRGRAVGSLIIDEVRRLLAAARASHRTVSAVGASVPGIAHVQTGRVWAPNIPDWDAYPLRDELIAAVAEHTASSKATVAAAPAPERCSMAVAVDSDRAAYILGEVWQGAARGCRDAIFLAVGTGIGAGILADGRVLRGARGIAGAIGWLALDRPFTPDYAACGCFESHASGEGLAKVARLRLHEGPGVESSLRSIEQLTAHDVFRACDAGDVLALSVVREAVEFWGMAAANLVSLFNPEKIIFGGGVFGPAVRLLPDIAAEARRWAQPISIQQVEFVPSQLGSDAGLLGAAYIAHTSASPRWQAPPIDIFHS